MKKWIVILSSLVAVTAFGSTLTTYYSLKKPADGSTSWGQDIRDDLDEIDLQMKTNSNTIQNHLSDTVGAHAATAISTSVGGSLCVSAITVQAFLDCLDSNVGPVLNGGVVTLAGTQTVTGLKTFSSLLTASSGLNVSGTGVFNTALSVPGTINFGAFSTGLLHSNGSGDISSSAVVNADIDAAAAIARSKLASGTASHVLTNDGSGVMSSEAQLAMIRGGTNKNMTASNGAVAYSDADSLELSAVGSSGQVLQSSGAGAPAWTTATYPASTTINQILYSSSANVVAGISTGNIGALITDSSGVPSITASSADGNVLRRSSGAIGFGNISLTDTDTVTSGAATAGQVLTADGASGTSWSTPATAPDQSYEISNLSLAASVGSNALTIAVKDKAGNDPSGGSPVRIGFRNSTLTTGTYNQRSVSAALSTVISSGSTAGHSSSGTYNIYIYALDNAGTVELAWSSVIHDESNLITTTAEGGAGGADSIRIMYSTTARTNVPFRLIGFLTSTQSTAGTWASTPSKISTGSRQTIIPKTIHFEANRSVGYNISTTTDTEIVFNSVIRDDLNSFNTSNGRYTIPVTGIWTFSSICGVYAGNGGGTWDSGNVCQFHAGLGGARDSLHTAQWRAHNTDAAAGYEAMVPLTWSYRYSAGDTVSLFIWHNEGATAITGDTNNCWFNGYFVGEYQ